MFEASGARAAALLVGGVGGGFDSPANNLYDRLGGELPFEGIAVLRVRYRNPTDLAGAVEDVQTGVAFLRAQGVERVGLVGHSFGGAVVVRAALAEPAVSTVVTLSTQLYGTGRAGALKRPALLVHGTDDEILPPGCSVRLHELMGPDAQLRLFEGARHTLDGVADDVFALVHQWLKEHLAPV